MNTEIIAVGTELLLGEIVNSNASYLSEKLAELGINVYRHTTIGDNRQRLIDALGAAFNRADIVITTGGLGPTIDDITKEAAAEYFGLQMELHEESLLQIESFFARIGAEMKENNKRQAYFPKGAKLINEAMLPPELTVPEPICCILDNPAGTAPGCVIIRNGKICILLPGPPKEVSVMYERHVKRLLLPYSNEVLVSKTLRFVGIGESSMEDAVKDIIEVQENPTIAPYASNRIGEVTLRITAKAKDAALAKELIEPTAKKIYERLGEYIYGEDEDDLAGVVVRRLKELGLTLAAAESITGGSFSAAIINIPGASEVFCESYVTYSNNSKIKLLGVNEETLQNHGAVSAETAEEMAIGTAKRSGADVAVSFTGIAGPGGGTAEKPVGLTYIGLHFRGKTETKKHMLFGDRNRIRERAVTLGLDLIRRFL